jgi:4-amino-4-deoxy-L-arabinose transferase-like glycosyltransferase
VHREVQPVLTGDPPDQTAARAHAAGRVGPRERALLAALLAALAVVLLFRLGGGELQGAAEARVHGVVLEMERSGDWLVPRLHGEVRLNKPPLYYWAATACARVLGTESAWALRLPAALACLALVWVTWRWARRLGGPGLGLLAAAALACMVQTTTFGRTGEAEMFLALFSTLALAAFERLLAAPAAAGPANPAQAAARRRALPLFALWTALAILSKATVALMLIGVPVVLALTAQRRWRQALAPRVLLWTGAGLLAGFLWYGVILAVVPGAWSALGGAALLPSGVRLPGAEGAGHVRPAWYFLGSLLLSAFPVTLLLPRLLARGATSRFWADAPRLRFVALAFLAAFVCFSLLPQKQKHYMLPLLPLLAILAAEAVLELEARAPARLRRLLLLLAVAGALLSAPGLLVLHVVYVQALAVAPALYAVVVAGALLLLLLLARAAAQSRVQRFAGVATAGFLLALLCYHGSLELWSRQFESGSVTARPDYDPARWRAVFEAWPTLEGVLRAGEQRG